MQPGKLSRWLNLLIKALLFAALGLLLYRQVLHNDNLRHVIDRFQTGLERSQWTLLSGVIILTFVNWGIEVVKWRLLILKLRPITWRKCIKGILFGITFSLFTPNRLGEFGGRVMAITQNRIPALVSSLVGSLSQIVTNVTLGGIGLMIFLFLFQHPHFYLFSVIMLLFLSLVVILHLAYYNLEVWSNAMHHIKMLKKIYQHIDIVQQYSWKDLFRLQAYSSIRYLVYCMQYVIMLNIFGVDLPTAKALIIVTTIFFVQTALPTIALLDLGIRGNVALYFLQPYTENAIGILAATFGLWLINLILPGIVGGLAALNFKFFREA